jgi:hypothetical protein
MLVNATSQIEVHLINHDDIVDEMFIFVTLEKQTLTQPVSFPSVSIAHSLSGKATSADL